jgi:hypothetical protein
MVNPKIKQIPIPGGSGAIPTGAMQFQDDWPGLFIRGDDAVMLAFSINIVLERLKDAIEKDAYVWASIHRLRHISEIVERDVRVK